MGRPPNKLREELDKAYELIERSNKESQTAIFTLTAAREHARMAERDAVVRAAELAKDVETLSALNEKLSKEHADLNDRHYTLRGELAEAKESLKESREHFAEMKQKLYEAKIEIAEARGYMNRVREDDNARDGFDVVEEARDVIVPRRAPMAPTPVRQMDAVGTTRAFAGAPRRHWTDY